MEALLRAALIGWLQTSTGLAGLVNSVTEEAPFTDQVPWLAISTSSAVDWSTKTEPGAEVRIALDLRTRADQPGADAPILAAIDAAVRALPPVQTGFTVISVHFLRSRAAQNSPTTRTTLIEYRFRVQAA